MIHTLNQKNNVRPIFISSVFPSGHKAGGVYHSLGIAPTIMSNHNEVIRVLEHVEQRSRENVNGRSYTQEPCCLD